MRSSERTDCIKSLIKLRQQEVIIEKSLHHFFDNTKLESEILGSLKNEERSRVSERKKFENSLRKTVADITNELKSIKSAMSAMQEGQKIDTDSLKSKLISIADKIREFKKISELESLANEEIELDRDLHSVSLALQKREVRNFRSNSSIAPKESSMSKTSGATDFIDYSSLRDFDALIAKTGHTESWSEEDHLLFLKIRKTSRSVVALVAAIRKKCPDLTSERIVNHEAWYKIYLELREKQRKAIKDWREKREAEKKCNIARAASEIQCPKSGEKMSNTKTVSKDEETAGAERKTTGRPTVTKTSSECVKKELLNRWRQDKENAKSLEAEKQRSAAESQEARKEHRRLARAKQLKSAVEAHKEKKIESRASSSTSLTDSERLTSKIEAARLIECYRRQDEEFLSRRRALLQSKKLPSSAPVRPRVQIPSDRSSTVLKPTKGWLEKCKAEETLVDPHRQIMYVKEIPKLAACIWKNQEST